tara:strand:+ start:36157 stop:36837 length:681 start_codon:yes stop_codon:yes gene_type:complete
MRTGVVIVYSSIDDFLWGALSARVQKFADEVIVVSRTHLFGGEPEPTVDMGVPSVLMGKSDGPGWKAVQEMRRAGLESLPPVDRVLFLDSDELPDQTITEHLDNPSPVYFAAEVYWREPWIRQVQNNEVAGLLCKPDEVVWNRRGEREAMTSKRIVRPRPDKPFMHHFAWCKPLDAMVKKVQNWGHSGDRGDWVAMVKEEWARPLPGNCFVHKGRLLEECEQRIKI